MATKKEYLNFILDQLSGLSEITYRMMMGEYIIYYRGKIAAYVCDDRLLVKPVDSVKHMLPEAPLEPPYEGAKDMVLVEDIDNREFMEKLFDAMYEELPAPKKKK
ncbi:MAG: TfoX/Sxy family protein [Hespellia sp.]|nr:TfoX/Sxy family protein [Hespellia sp.]